ncbi:hypothetical protein BDR04DRAFT_1122559 [Suillus decipiens]|nr:hypothetical protein BDR04DRAFT_1122559 [Suillus decipiens]
MMKNAHVDQPAPNKPPKLTPGELMPEVACNWKNACSTYFMHKGIKARDQNWIEEIKHLDDKCLEDIASHKKIAEELYKSSKCTTSSNKPSSAKTYNPSSSCLRFLTEAEHALLMKHRGCFKCRKFYVPHQSKDCTDGTPEASSYKTLTEADAIAAKPKTGTVAAVGPIGAVMPSMILDDGDDTDDEMTFF